MVGEVQGGGGNGPQEPPKTTQDSMSSFLRRRSMSSTKSQVVFSCRASPCRQGSAKAHKARFLALSIL
jgi:hypothetical protein